MLLSQILLGLRWNTLNVLENLCFCKTLNYANMDGPESQIHAINGFVRLRKKEPIMTCIWSAKQRCCSLLNDLRWCTAIARPWNLCWCAEVYKWWGSNDGYPFVWNHGKSWRFDQKFWNPIKFTILFCLLSVPSWVAVIMQPSVLLISLLMLLSRLDML